MRKDSPPPEERAPPKRIRNAAKWTLRKTKSAFRCVVGKFDIHASILFLPVATVMLFDVIFTLSGQSEAYWREVFVNFWSFSYNGSNEQNFLGRILLEFHPLVFFGLYGLYAFFVYCLLIYKNHFVRLCVFLAVMIGHTAGAGSWISIRKPGKMNFAQYLLRNVPEELPIPADELYFIIEICFYLAMTIIGASILWVYWEIYIKHEKEARIKK